ncbi:MAG: dipicolinate synthase [Ruminococcaceae bacterium]|nr:dipicolinate synthase [Oscillospiraceae bacterium]
MNMTFGVIGGDRRQAELACLLRNDQHTVYTYGLNKRSPGEESSLDRAASADAVILPLPLCRGDGVLNCEENPVPTIELFRRFKSSQRILAGQVKPQQYREARSCGVEIEDYFLREELTVANAAATAEAAIQVAMERLDRILLGMDCLVLGFGRIGKLLCSRLHGLGARVTATARKQEDLAWIRAYGWPALDTGALSGKLGGFGVVLNTVPSLILDEPLLRQLPPDCLCIDLASVPGIDLAAAERRGLPAVWARSLPGRMVPRTAAAAIRDAVYYILSRERGGPA